MLLTEIEARLTGQVYPPSEAVLWRDGLRHLSSGMASRYGARGRRGAVWGVDYILWNPESAHVRGARAHVHRGARGAARRPL